MTAFPGNRDTIPYRPVEPLVGVFPNLVSLELSGLNVDVPIIVCCSLRIHFRFPWLSRFTWNGCEDLTLEGTELESFANLTELYLDDCCFSAFSRVLDMFSDPSNDTKYLLMERRRLGRLSIKNATYCVRDSDGSGAVTQDMLIKMVRRHPTLRWLRSDLTAENIAMLQQERPEITFVSD